LTVRFAWTQAQKILASLPLKVKTICYEAIALSKSFSGFLSTGISRSRDYFACHLSDDMALLLRSD
jgi:hypothetical protein